MKKRTISKLKSLFGSKKGKRKHQESTKSSRSASPEPGQASPTNDTSFQPITDSPQPHRVGPPPSPPVPTHPIAPVPPDSSGPLPLKPCTICGRTFVPQSLAKHAKICEKMAIKKRKMFDSSRQRRVGTDLEQYLPKNFGLPENSPFLEKSPPNTAKVAPKPKPAVRNVMKPNADLQRCPHCNRTFGLRAFERHVEWCADKAKILPATPAQPPPHISEAKNRLNARTQYKAPLARGRRSSQTRDKSSNSRSASVESSRGVSPPAPREYGDCKHGRGRLASESASSNDCHDDASPHMPVIRNSRNTKNSAGDANVKARQARLARDLSSSRKSQETPSSPVHKSSTDPNIRKNAPKSKPKNTFSLKKQDQIKKLEEIANKYNERQQKLKDELAEREKNCAANKSNSDKSQIPLAKKLNPRKNKRGMQDNQSAVNSDTTKELVKVIQSPKPSTSKTISKPLVVPPQMPTKEKKSPEVNNTERKVKRKATKKETVKVVKESTMSLDSLEDGLPTSAKDRSHQSIGINTELLCPCVPCVIHEGADPKVPPKIKFLSDMNDKNDTRFVDKNIPEPKVELLYKNLTMVSSCDIQSRDNRNEPEFKEDTSISNFDNSRSMITPSNSDNMVLSDIECRSESFKSKSMDRKFTDHVECQNIKEKKEDDVKVKRRSNGNVLSEKMDEDIQNLSAENYEENYERDMSEYEDSIENHDDDNANEQGDVMCRHGSGDTYTKFTEDPTDLEEFMNITDKMMTIHNFNKDSFEIEKQVDNLHTPKTDSIESISKDGLDKENAKTDPDKHNFSDSLDELKSNLKELLDGAGDNVNDALKEDTDSETNRKVSDMEHITVYELKFYEWKPGDVETPVKPVPKFKLPSIVENNKPQCKDSSNKKRIQDIYKTDRKYKMLGEDKRGVKEYQTFIKEDRDDSDSQSISAEAPPLKLPRIEKKRLDDGYDPFVSAARQMKELMSSDTNIPKKVQNSCKDTNRTLPILRPSKEKPALSNLRSDNTKMMKDSLNKTYQKTPTLQRMKSFGSTNTDNHNNTFGGRCSSFRLNRNDKKPSQKLNTTFTKSSKENVSTTEKNYFNRSSNLNRSFSSYTNSAYSTPKPKDKIPKIATSMYHSFQRTTIKQPVKLDKIKKDNNRKDFVNLDAILADDNSSMTDSNYIDPRLINEHDNLPINVNTILNNPDIISSMESLLTTENLPAKFESFNTNVQNNNTIECNGIKAPIINKIETNNNINMMAPIIDDLSAQYDKIMSSLEQSIASKTSIRDDDSLCEDFDIEEFMTTFDEEIHKQKIENKRTCSSTTRVVKPAELGDSNRTSELNSISSSPKVVYNDLIPINKSPSLNFSSNNIVNENLFPSSVKRSTSLLDSIQKKTMQKMDVGKSRQKSDLLEQDIMQSLKDFDKFYESERIEHSGKEVSYNTPVHSGTAKRVSRVKSERKTKTMESVTNGNYTPTGKACNDSAYSSLNRISPSKLSVCNSKELNGSHAPERLEQIAAGSDSSGGNKEACSGSGSSEEFLAMERSAELDAPLPRAVARTPFKDDHPHANEKRVSSRTPSRQSHTWRTQEKLQLSSSGSEASLHPPRDSAPATLPRLSRFCHECGSKFPVDTAKFCIECGVRRLMV